MGAVAELTSSINIRGDRGVENIAAGIRRFLNCNQRDRYRSFLFGKSMSN